MAAAGLWDLFLGLSRGWLVWETLLMSWAFPWWPRALVSQWACHRAPGFVLLSCSLASIGGQFHTGANGALYIAWLVLFSCCRGDGSCFTQMHPAAHGRGCLLQELRRRCGWVSWVQL